MKTSTFLLFLAFLCVAGGFYLSSAMFGSAAIGIILTACVIFYFAGGSARKLDEELIAMPLIGREPASQQYSS
jgi:hypothetical protein